MKEGIHPEYKEVVFFDTSSNEKFLTRSCVDTKGETTDFEGKDYPCFMVEVSSSSHPYYTGKKLFVDAAGRVEKFNKKYKR